MFCFVFSFFLFVFCFCSVKNDKKQKTQKRAGLLSKTSKKMGVQTKQKIQKKKDQLPKIIGTIIFPCFSPFFQIFFLWIGNTNKHFTELFFFFSSKNKSSLFFFSPPPLFSLPPPSLFFSPPPPNNMSTTWVEELQQLLSDPITYDLMDDAVITPYGHTYSEMALKRWLLQNPCCPVSQQKLSLDQLSPNYAVRDLVKFMKANPARFESTKDAVGGLRFGQDAEGIRKKLYQSELELRVSKALLDEHEGMLSSLSSRKCENVQNRAILEEKLEVFGDEMKKESEYLNLQKEMAEKLSDVDKKESDLVDSINAKKAKVNDLTVQLSEARKSLLPSFLSNEKETLEELLTVERELQANQESLERITSKKKDVSENLVRATRLLEEVILANQGPRKEIAELESKMSFLQGEYSAMDSEENQVLFRVTALKVQVKGLESELTTLRQDMEEYKRIMREFLQSAEEMDQRVSDDFQTSLDAVRLKEKGNEKFRAKNYEEAAIFYSRAIEVKMDPAFFLNRAAANTHLNRLVLARKDCMQV